MRTGGDPRRRRNLQETGAPPPRLLRPPPATTAAPASYRVSGAPEDRTAEIRPLFRPGTAAHRSGRAADNSPRCPGRRKWGPQSPGRPARRGGFLGSAQSQNELTGRRGGFCGSRLPSRGHWAPWHSRCHPATRQSLAGRGLANPQPWERSQALCFSRSAQGQGNPACLLVGMDYWKIRRKVPCTSACTVLFGSQQAVK